MRLGFNVLAGLALTGAVMACDDDDDTTAGGVGQTARVELRNAQGQAAGTATLTETATGVQVSISAVGLPAGAHGFHFHENGQCAPTFEAAGEHYNPTARQHGVENSQGPHAADLPNLVIAASGAGTLTTTNPYLTLRDGEPNSLFKAGGTALIIHTNADDHRTDPSGNSGGRIACGVVQR